MKELIEKSILDLLDENVQLLKDSNIDKYHYHTNLSIIRALTNILELSNTK